MAATGVMVWTGNSREMIFGRNDFIVIVGCGNHEFQLSP